MFSCDKHSLMDTSPDADECPSCKMGRVLAGLPPGRRPVDILTSLETCLRFLEWLTKHPMDFAAVLIGEQDARELVARYIRGS
jgi:hypothetical protein